MSIAAQAGNLGNIQIDALPNECPICHHAMEPQPLAGWGTGDANATATEVHLAMRCGRRLCQSMFIGRYGGVAQGPRTLGIWNLQGVTPTIPRLPVVAQEVAELSPNYVKILQQASVAEAHDLDEIAGVGFRKALEFLVKDFCIAQSPENGDAIRRMQLGSVIQEFVADARIKNAARRAAWLGNDEAHYVQRWEQKDIRDLKALLNLTAVWIHSHLLTDKYMREMPE